MHVHFGVADFLVFAAYIVIFGFFWRTLAGLNHNNALGQGMAFVF